MLVIRHVFGTGTHCIAPSGLPLLLSLFPGLAPWAFLSRPCGASFAPETSLVTQGGRNDNHEYPSGEEPAFEAYRARPARGRDHYRKGGETGREARALPGKPQTSKTRRPLEREDLDGAGF